MKKSNLIIMFSFFATFNLYAQNTYNNGLNADLYKPKLAPLTCEYLITNEWNTGFTGIVQLTNLSEKDVEGWSLKWNMQQNILTNTWNASIETTVLENKTVYYANNLQWNEVIKSGQTIEFGFQGDKLDNEIENVIVLGEKCRYSITK